MSVSKKQQAAATFGAGIIGRVVRNRREWQDLPVGVVLRHHTGRSNHIWTKVSDRRAANGYHMYPDGLHQQRVNFDHFGTEEYRVIGDFTRFYSATMEGSLEGYKARFKHAITTAATRNSVSPDVVTRALRDLECEGIEGGITMGGPLIGRDLGALPTNSVVAFGDPTSDLFTLWRKSEGGQWVAMLAGNAPLPETNNQRILVSAPGIDAVWVAPTDAQSAEEEQAINEFKARAYRVGLRQKRAHGWCDVYDNVMESIGITRDTLTEATAAGYRLGATVAAEDAATLPNRAILYSLDDHGTFHLFIRDDNCLNMARTRVVFSGDGDRHNYNRRMRLGSGGNRVPGDALIPDTVLNTERLEQLPVGTRFFVGTDVENVWCITARDVNNRYIGYTNIRTTDQQGWDNLPQGIAARYRQHDFGTQPITLVSMPDPDNPGRSIY